MKRAIVNVATDRYVPGQRRLASMVTDADLLIWTDAMPPNCPPHKVTPYAFKPFAMAEALGRKYDAAIWVDACVVPVAPLADLWTHIEREGYWFPNNGWNTGQWCADSALEPLGITRAESFGIPHMVATAMGLDLRNARTLEFLHLWLEQARDGRAFRGPWRNDVGEASGDSRVLGHRHDQTVASVIAWRLGMRFINPPKFFAYKGGETAETVLMANGAY